MTLGMWNAKLSQSALAGLAVVSLIVCAACGTREPTTDAERLARGRELVEQMSARLAAAKAVSVTTTEVRDIVRVSGAKEPVSQTAVYTVRRPDRFYNKMTGGRGLETWYNGKTLTIAAHPHKVFAQAPMPETIDRTLDALAERYDMALPMGDLFYSSAAKALLSDTTTGGYVGTENVGSTPAVHLAFKDVGVDWELWLPVQGDPLPLRLKVVQKSRKGQPVGRSDVHVVGPRAAGHRRHVRPKVPAEFEGIAIVQRAAAVKSRRRRATCGARRTGHKEIASASVEPKGSRHHEGTEHRQEEPSVSWSRQPWSRWSAWRRSPRRCAPAGAAPSAKGDNGAAAAGPRGAAVKGEEGYAAAGRRGAVVSGEEGYAAVGRNGNVVTGEEVDVQGGAVGRRGAVVVGEEGAAAVGRYGGVVVGDRYESYDAWKAVAAVGAGIAIGTMLAKPPAAATTVVVTGSTYYYHDSAYYTKVMSSGRSSYQVVEPPAGAIITTLPAGCKSVRVGNATYRSAAPRITRECRRDIRSSCCSEPGPETLTCGPSCRRSPHLAFPASHLELGTRRAPERRQETMWLIFQC